MGWKAPWEKEFWTQNMNPTSDNFLGRGKDPGSGFEYKTPDNTRWQNRLRRDQAYQDNIMGRDDGPQIIGRDDDPQIIGRDDGPQIIGRDDDPQIIGRDDGPQIIGRDDDPQIIGRDDGPQIIGRDDDPQIIGRDDGPQIIGRDDGPQIIGRDDGPQIIGRDDAVSPGDMAKPEMMHQVRFARRAEPAKQQINISNEIKILITVAGVVVGLIIAIMTTPANLRFTLPANQSPAEKVNPPSSNNPPANQPPSSNVKPPSSSNNDSSSAPQPSSPISQEPDHCDIFDDIEMKEYYQDWSIPLSMNIKMPGGVPDDWDYQVEIGDYSAICEPLKDYPELLHCDIKLPSDYVNSMKPIALYVEGCDESIFPDETTYLPGGAPSSGSGGSSGGSGGSSCTPDDTSTGQVYVSEAVCKANGWNWDTNIFYCYCP